MIKYFAALFLSFGFSFVVAQVDTSIILQKIEIRDHWPPDENSYTNPKDIRKGITSVDKIRSLAELVSNSTGIYVKSYGPSSISSISSRGSGASQNLVLWNDIPLNNPMIGQLDFGLISPFLFDNINISVNASSSNWANGTPGAIVNLQDKSEWNKGINYTYLSSVGSFENYNNGGQFSFSNNKWNVEIEGTRLQGKNNFPYHILGQTKSRVIKHAKVSQHHVKPSAQFKWNHKHSTSLHAWLTESFRQIPPTTTQDESAAFQEDGSEKYLLQHKVIHQHSHFTLKAYYSDEKLSFVDSINQIDDSSYFNSYAGQVHYERRFGTELKVNVNSQFVRNEAFHPSYQRKRNSNEFSSSIGFLKTLKTWKLGFSSRILSFTSNPVQIIPAGTIEKVWNPYLVTKASVHRNYRYPTLNELFWIPGGNTELKAESGWSQELTQSYRPSINPRNIVFHVSLYNKFINDWILWTPKEGEFYYTPSNIAQVWSRGIDADFELRLKRKEHSFTLFSGYHLVKATNQKSIHSPSIKKGSQLFYTPRHQADFSITWTFQRWLIKANHQFTSKVTGINEQIPGYFLGDFDIEKSIQIKHLDIIIFGSIRNFTNQNYRVIERRPMPGRNFTVGLILTNHKINHE